MMGVAVLAVLGMAIAGVVGTAMLNHSRLITKLAKKKSPSGCA